MDNGKIYIYTVPIDSQFRNFEEGHVINAHKKRVMGVFYDQDSRQIISVGEDGVLKVSSVETGEVLHTVEFKNSQGLKALDYDQENNRFFIPDGDGKIHILNALKSPPEVISSVSLNKKSCIRGFTRDHANSYFFTGDVDGQIGVFELGKPGKERFSKQIAAYDGVKNWRFLTWDSDQK